MIDLFAGAGGMGLAVLDTPAFNESRLIMSAEIEERYLPTLELNHRYFGERIGEPSQLPAALTSVDLASEAGFSEVARVSKSAGGCDIIIGGPPCQGFSKANRNSGALDHPQNELAQVFINYVDHLRPKAVVMENVPAIADRRFDARGREIRVSDMIASKIRALGYTVFSKILNAADFGVPQHRERFFLIALRPRFTDQSLLDRLGPFPEATHGESKKFSYVSVLDALGDLPRIKNGEDRSTISYSAPTFISENSSRGRFLKFTRNHADKEFIFQHIVSQQAEYVIERYREVPEGGNWRDIRHMLTNYSNVERTHSSIYRRLRRDAPSVTIGNFRKSMLIHPTQHRGLSLREAARLQSLPDWFQFEYNGHYARKRRSGLSFFQQQIGNAVSYRLSQQIAGHIGKLLKSI